MQGRRNELRLGTVALVLECVVNVSEGRRPEVVAAVAAACRPALLDVHTDADHHRSVLTLAGPAGEVAEAALALARVAVERIDLSAHSGVHPRLGAVDVVPFVPLDGLAGATGPGREAGLERAAEIAREWGERAAAELAVPVFLYGGAHPERRTLPDVRRAAFKEWPPDFGPADPHPTAGAMAVGARPVLVAVNCELAGGPEADLGADVAVARAVAQAIRERDGGLPGVRALGLALASKGRAQVSMNLTDLAATGVEAACEAVRRAAAERGGDVTAVELVGLLPAAELERCSGEFLAWSGLSADRTIEARLGRSGSG
jgi:glutamate formiminotransferase